MGSLPPSFLSAVPKSAWQWWYIKGFAVMSGLFVKVCGVGTFTVAKRARHPAGRPCIDVAAPQGVRDAA